MDGNNARDLDLIERVRAGDRKAFDELVEPFRRKLYLHITRIVKNPNDADDVFQETFIRAFQGLRHFRGEAGFYTWLYRIAVNCACASLRQSKRRLADAGDELANTGAQSDAHCSSDPAEVLAGSQMAAIVSAALEEMRLEFRNAIVLREIEGMSYHDIGQEMLCPIGTVKSRISSARTAIAARLSRHGFSAKQSST